MELPSSDRNPHTSPSDIEQGRKLYMGRCAGCHGLTGDGGKGANLAVRQLQHATSDRALYRIVRYGLPETEMPSTLMAPREVWQIAAFVRTLSASSGSSSGNPARGAQLAVSSKANCLQCHAIGLRGGTMAPALTDIGNRRGPGHLRAKLTDPNSDIPDTFRLASLTTSDGRQLTGIRLNEDPFSIQLRDFAGRFHSLEKSQLRSLTIERRTTMPSYKDKLSPTEIEDLVAYLLSLRGAR